MAAESIKATVSQIDESFSHSLAVVAGREGGGGGGGGGAWGLGMSLKLLAPGK